MQIVNITTNNVDIELLNKQRLDLHELLVKTEPTGNGDLWGLLGLLDHICDKYESVLYSTCNCECGCEVPLDGGTCVDCGDGEHQNNNGLETYNG